MNLFRLVLIIILLCSVAFGRTSSKKTKTTKKKTAKTTQEVSIYIHPVSLLTGPISELTSRAEILSENKLPFYFYLTGEYSFDKFNSLIVTPSLWGGGSGEYKSNKQGIRAGWRRYAMGGSEGLYLQATASAHHLRAKHHPENTQTDATRSKSYFFGDIMLSAGYAIKYGSINLFADAGIGYGGIAGKPPSTGSLLNPAHRNTGVSPDINLAVGIPLKF
jgi:hypothetical protein